MASPGTDRRGSGLRPSPHLLVVLLAWESREPHALSLARCALPGPRRSLPRAFLVLSPFRDGTHVPAAEGRLQPKVGRGAPPTLAGGRGRGEPEPSPRPGAAAPLRSRSAVTRARSPGGRGGRGGGGGSSSSSLRGCSSPRPGARGSPGSRRASPGAVLASTSPRAGPDDQAPIAARRPLPARRTAARARVAPGPGTGDAVWKGFGRRAGSFAPRLCRAAERSTRAGAPRLPAPGLARPRALAPGDWVGVPSAGGGPGLPGGLQQVCAAGAASSRPGGLRRRSARRGCPGARGPQSRPAAPRSPRVSRAVRLQLQGLPGGASPISAQRDGCFGHPGAALVRGPHTIRCIKWVSLPSPPLTK